MHLPLPALLMLYVAFAAKHLAADFFLQTFWMAHGKGARAGWLAPLTAHAAIHAGLTLAIVVAAVPALAWLALADFALHAAIDRTKGVLTRGWSLDRAPFWWALGADQCAHHLTHFGFVLTLAAGL